MAAITPARQRLEGRAELGQLVITAAQEVRPAYIPPTPGAVVRVVQTVLAGQAAQLILLLGRMAREGAEDRAAELQEMGLRETLK